MENLVLPLAKAGLITLAILSGLGSIGYGTQSAGFLPNGRRNREREALAGKSAIYMAAAIVLAVWAGSL
jgi:hypothetical protein